MTTMVTESRPAKHGKRLNGKKVMVYSKNRAIGAGIYRNDGRTWFRLESAFGEYYLSKADTTIEEIIERVE